MDIPTPSQPQEIVRVSASQDHTATVIFVHVRSDHLTSYSEPRLNRPIIQGLGQSNLTWKIVVTEALAPRLPHVGWILPQA